MGLDAAAVGVAEAAAGPGVALALGVPGKDTTRSFTGITPGPTTPSSLPAA
jgi:hypothetical protein